NNASGLVAGTTPVYTDTVGPVFAPAIMLGASEPLDATTVTTVTVKLLRANSTEVPINVAYTPSSTQITIMPRVTLSNGTYRVTVTTGMRDAGQCASGTVHHQLYHRRSATSGLCADDPTVILVKRGGTPSSCPPINAPVAKRVASAQNRHRHRLDSHNLAIVHLILGTAAS
ncbi:MAG: Ig-like domain-containing protein, partial [Chloroflexus sp.]|nr:Ig-like domain-containing protein [Chloroflexus sp.]